MVEVLLNERIDKILYYTKIHFNVINIETY